MVRVVFKVMIVAVALHVSAMAAEPCAQQGSHEENISLVRRFYEALNSVSPSSLDEVLSEDWRDIPLPPGQAAGRVGMKASVMKFGTVFSKFHVTNDEFIVAGDKVVVRSTNTGIHTGAFAGMAPTGKSFAMISIDIHRVCNGRIIETRHVEDWLGMLEQIGALPVRPTQDKP